MAEPRKCTEGCNGIVVGRFKIRAGWVVKYRCSNCHRTWTERE